MLKSDPCEKNNCWNGCEEALMQEIKRNPHISRVRDNLKKKKLQKQLKH